MQPQLHMWEPTRQGLLARHDFYVSQVRKRVLLAFDDIEGEAERYAEAEYERLGRVLDPERFDQADAAEMATDRSHGFYALLSDLKTQVRLGALAGLYHQWDKELRQFLERELSHNFKPDDVITIVWKPAEIGAIIDLLRDHFGWDSRRELFFDDIEACRLIVNVHKHGKGRSLRLLADHYPEFLRKPLASLPRWSRDWIDHRWLQITDEQFARIAGSLRAFWEAFPERLHLTAAD